jgi:hypothetical protein
VARCGVAVVPVLGGVGLSLAVGLLLCGLLALLRVVPPLRCDLLALPRDVLRLRCVLPLRFALPWRCRDALRDLDRLELPLRALLVRRLELLLRAPLVRRLVALLGAGRSAAPFAASSSSLPLTKADAISNGIWTRRRESSKVARGTANGSMIPPSRDLWDCARVPVAAALQSAA